MSEQLEAQPSRRTLLAWSVLLGCLAIATRGFELGRPGTFVFDEIFYANDAVDLITHGAERTYVGHPPLGKWLIGLGPAVAGFSPTTWRLAAVAAGAGVVILVFICVATRSGSAGAGVAAATLVLSDGVAHAAGRYALLDGFAALFTTAIFVLVVCRRAKPFNYRFAILLGVLCGAALAVKWTSLPAVLMAVVVCTVWDRRASIGSRLAVAATVTGIAAVAYFASFTPWIVSGAPYGNCVVPECRGSVVDRLVRLPSMQVTMIEGDAKVDRSAGPEAPGWRWILPARPLVLLREQCLRIGDPCPPAGPHRVKVAMNSNPVLWLTFPVVVVLLLLLRTRRVASVPATVLLVLWPIVLWLPWALRRYTYIFYAAPVVPGLAVAVTLGIWTLVPPDRRSAALIGVCGLASASFLLANPSTHWWL